MADRTPASCGAMRVEAAAVRRSEPVSGHACGCLHGCSQAFTPSRLVQPNCFLWPWPDDVYMHRWPLVIVLPIRSTHCLPLQCTPRPGTQMAGGSTPSAAGLAGADCACWRAGALHTPRSAREKARARRMRPHVPCSCSCSEPQPPRWPSYGIWHMAWHDACLLCSSCLAPPLLPPPPLLVQPPSHPLRSMHLPHFAFGAVRFSGTCEASCNAPA